VAVLTGALTRAAENTIQRAPTPKGLAAEKPLQTWQTPRAAAKGEYQLCGIDKLGVHWSESSTAHTRCRIDNVSCSAVVLTGSSPRDQGSATFCANPPSPHWHWPCRRALVMYFVVRYVPHEGTAVIRTS
jgi:hypothetical protein